MNAILGPTLELTVLLPGMLLAYLPVIPCLKQSPRRLAAWLAPLLLALCILGGMLCRALECPTRPVLFALLPPAMMLYHKTLRISLWKSVSIFLAVCAVFACVNSFCRAINAVLAVGLPPSRLLSGSSLPPGFYIMASVFCFCLPPGIRPHTLSG